MNCIDSITKIDEVLFTDDLHRDVPILSKSTMRNVPTQLSRLGMERDRVERSKKDDDSTISTYLMGTRSSSFSSASFSSCSSIRYESSSSYYQEYAVSQPGPYDLPDRSIEPKQNSITQTRIRYLLSKQKRMCNNEEAHEQRQVVPKQINVQKADMDTQRLPRTEKPINGQVSSCMHSSHETMVDTSNVKNLLDKIAESRKKMKEKELILLATKTKILEIHLRNAKESLSASLFSHGYIEEDMDFKYDALDANGVAHNDTTGKNGEWQGAVNKNTTLVGEIVALEYKMTMNSIKIQSLSNRVRARTRSQDKFL